MSDDDKEIVAETEEELVAQVEGDDEGGEDEEPEVEYKGRKIRLSKEAKEAWDEWQGEFTRGRMSQAEEKKAIEAERTKVQEQARLQQEFMNEAADIRSLDRQIAEYSKVDWIAWEEQDETAARKAERQFNRIKTQRAEMAGALANKVREQQQKIQQEREARRTEAKSKIPLHVKDWNEAREASLKAFAKERGFSEEEAEAISHDHRIAAVFNDAFTAKDAMKRASATTKVKETVVTPLPTTTVKTKSSAVSASPRDDDDVDTWMKKFRKTQYTGTARRR